jgi:hypothetical protein
VNDRPEEDRATTTPTAVEGRREGTTRRTGMSSLGSSHPCCKGVSPCVSRRYSGVRVSKSADVSAANRTVASANSLTLRVDRSRSVSCGPAPIGVDDDRRSSRSPSSRSAPTAGGRAGTAEAGAPAGRSGAERGLAPRPRSRPVRGTGGTVNERRCGVVRGGAASILPLRPPCTPSGAVIRREKVATEGIGS